jgi:antitoxin component YwqK of YwqJK toxin-antitoxin module
MRSLNKVIKNKTDKNGLKQGYWEFYHDKNQLHSKGLYKDGLKESMWEFYLSNGQLHYKGSYKEGKEDGIWEIYDDGNLTCRMLYNGNLTKWL